MALTNVQRARIILDLIKDGEVTSDAAYSSVDLAPAAIVQKYGQLFWDANAQPAAPPPSNQQLAGFMLRQLRRHIAQITRNLHDAQVAAAEQAARVTGAAALAAEIDSELGTN